MEGAWLRRAVGPGCLGGADGSSPACYCCGRLWRGWRGEERVSRDVAAAAVPGAWVPYLAARLPALPPTGSQGLGGVGCAWKRGIGKTAPLLLPLPLSPSRAPVRRCARTPGNLAQAAPPLRGAQAPPPRCRRCPPVSGCPASGNARSWGDRVGSAREKLLESLASPEPALGVQLKDCRESAQAGRYCFSLDSGPPEWGRGEQPTGRVCIWERWWGCSHLSPLLLSLVWLMRAALGVSTHTMMAML